MVATVFQSLRANVVKYFFGIFITFILAFGSIAIMVYASVKHEIPMGHLTRDANAIHESPFYFGFLSNLGALLWAAAGAITFFSYKLVAFDKATKSFIMQSFVFTLLLLVDDFFLLHEQILPEYLGIDELAWFVFYVGAMLVFLLKNRVVILQNNYIHLLLSLSFFGLSVMVDVVPFGWPGGLILEDGAKFVGIVFWMTYFYNFAFSAARPTTEMELPRLSFQPTAAEKQNVVSLWS